MIQQSDGDVSGPKVTLNTPELCERRRSSISLAIPAGANQLAASVEIKADEVEFGEAHGVIINRDGLFIEGKNVSEVHQDDLRILSELGRGACAVVKQAQVWRKWRGWWLGAGTWIARFEVLPHGSCSVVCFPSCAENDQRCFLCSGSHPKHEPARRLELAS